MKAGVARVNITPDRPICLAGYSARTGHSNGVYHDIFAKALVIENDEEMAVIITTDLIGFDSYMCSEVKSAVERVTGLKPDRVILSASHTHTGPEIRSDASQYVDEFDQAYARTLVKKIANTVKEAVGLIEPVTMAFHKAPCALAVNRRLPTPNGVEMRPNSAGISDHEVTVLRIDRSDGSPMALMMSYPCHPTTLGGYLVGGDYPGFAQSILEAEFPGCMAMFMQGCGADQKVRHVDGKGAFKSGPYQVAESLGQELARAVLVSLCSPPRPVEGSLTTQVVVTDLPLQAPPLREEAEQMSKNPDRFLAAWGREMLRIHDEGGEFARTRPFTIQCLGIGDFALVALAGEMCVGYSLQLKKDLNGRPAIIAGYTNGMEGYVPTAAMIPEGGYEVARGHYYDLIPAPYAPEVEYQIIGQVHKLLGLP